MVFLFTTMWPEGWQEQKPVFPLEAQDPGWGFSVCADLTARDYGEYKEATVIRIKRHLYFLNVLNSHFYDTVTQTPWKPGYEENRSFYRISSQTEPARSRCQHGRRWTARPQDTLITSFPNTSGEMTQSLSFRNLKIYERGHMMFVLEITVEWPLIMTQQSY